MTARDQMKETQGEEKRKKAEVLRSSSYVTDHIEIQFISQVKMVHRFNKKDK